MKIAHTADLHIDERDERFDDMCEVLRRMFMEMAREADLIIVAGDLAGRESAHHYTVRERLFLASVFLNAAASTPVVVVRGNHDRVDELTIFNMLHSQQGVIAIDTPSSDRVVIAGVSVLAHAFVQKRDLVIPSTVSSVEDLNRSASLSLASVMDRGRADGNIPNIGVFHIPVAGVRIGGYEIQTSQDVAVSASDLDKMDYDYIALGHIHERQQVASKAWYCGSPYPLGLGELLPKGYLLVDVGVGRDPEVEFRSVASWSICKLELSAEDVGDGSKFAFELPLGSGSHVRVRVKSQRGTPLAQSVIDRVVERLTRAGALSVRIQQDIEPVSEVRNSAVVEAQSDEEALRKLLSDEGLSGRDIERMTSKFESLQVAG